MNIDPEESMIVSGLNMGKAIFAIDSRGRLYIQNVETNKDGYTVLNEHETQTMLLFLRDSDFISLDES